MPPSAGEVHNFYEMASRDLHDIFSQCANERQRQPRGFSSSTPRMAANIRGGTGLCLHARARGYARCRLVRGSDEDSSRSRGPDRASERGRYPLDVDAPGVLHGLCKVVGRLKTIPGVRTAAERLVQADRHFGRDARTAIDEFR